MERYLLRFDSNVPAPRVVYLGGWHEDDVHDEKDRAKASRLDKREVDFEYSEEYKFYLVPHAQWRSAVEAE
jgi:hypothetical protein